MYSLGDIQAVSFDVGGTLIEPWPSVGQVYAEVASRHGLKGLAPDILDRNFLAVWQQRRDFPYTMEAWAMVVDATFEGLTVTPPSQTFFPALYQRFAEPKSWRVYDDVLPVLDELASRGLLLAIVSNWDERLRPLLHRLKLDRYFDALLISTEVAFAKPSPVIFELAAKKLGLPPEQVLHIGDSREEDVAGAHCAGFQALRLDRKGVSRPPQQIVSLRDILPLLSPAKPRLIPA